MFPKCLIVDDERHSRMYIHDLLNEFLPDAEIWEAAEANEAVFYLNNHNIDLLFLDIHMPETDGFSLLSQITEKNFEIVFITAYSQYTLPALRERALDYLLKPLKKSEFKKMLQRVLKIIVDKNQLPSTQKKSYLKQKIHINHQQGVKLISLSDIIYLKADNSYTIFFLNTGQKYASTKPLNNYENQLSPDHFFRIHKSYIINLDAVREYHSHKSGNVIMDDNSVLPVSRYRQADFLKILKNYPLVIKAYNSEHEI
ncbi:LytR/AlgR family response regulator transcription factor [Parapedobacter sp. 10938]|uniref:LytR/AlgR family response regulator transcription factor n=1 Tax=Parapedobacter flavus TaxID=3110225 RepID=UPI002DB88262|nr:LytTR family DNA-binding domain-containing protein [Parapedobacter sp. 10938]MEC3880231.1 LytTR family DNA-binding domain-containing protein [Parapedobacter sp. 10938]